MLHLPVLAPEMLQIGHKHHKNTDVARGRVGLHMCMKNVQRIPEAVKQWWIRCILSHSATARKKSRGQTNNTAIISARLLVRILRWHGCIDRQRSGLRCGRLVDPALPGQAHARSTSHDIFTSCVVTNIAHVHGAARRVRIMPAVCPGMTPTAGPERQVGLASRL